MATLTKKHFRDLAHALRQSRIEGHGLSTASQKYMREQWLQCVSEVAIVCKFYNTEFNYEKFREACEKGVWP